MRFTFFQYKLNFNVSFFLTIIILLIGIQPVAAHHPFGGKIPSNFLEGFLSGLGHPIIGIDHFAFIIASGLLGTKFKQGFLIPIAFVVATMAGTGIHLQEINLPQLEVLIAVSVIIFGSLLMIKRHSFFSSDFSTILVATVAMIVGIFHGYAYGEAIIGAQMSPLMAYLAGFSVIQLFVSLTAFSLAAIMIQRLRDKAYSVLRIIGMVISSLGFFFLGVAFGG